MVDVQFLVVRRNEHATAMQLTLRNSALSGKSHLLLALRLCYCSSKQSLSTHEQVRLSSRESSGAAFAHRIRRIRLMKNSCHR